MAAYTDAVLAPSIVRGTLGRRHAACAATSQPNTVRLSEDVRGLNVYARDGRLVFSTASPDRIGRRRTSPDLKTVVRTNAPSAQLVDPDGQSSHLWSRSGLRSATRGVESWAPPRSSLDDDVVTATIEGARSGRSGSRWGSSSASSGSSSRSSCAARPRGCEHRTRTSQPRSHDVVESSRELEATLLETIETLNAAVEARDPYTAGHSQRVRRVSLAIGRELRLPAKQLGALATAALFHDIGKIGMPDSILTKPDRLDRAEARSCASTSARGAEIVARISSLQDCVPAIRHHHERWDGLGYPDGLSGTSIPVEAAIIAIADAWDAMTTDRPYAIALDLDEAMLQIHAGRGKQFNPAVVDAFAAVARVGRRRSSRPTRPRPWSPSASRGCGKARSV